MPFKTKKRLTINEAAGLAVAVLILLYALTLFAELTAAMAQTRVPLWVNVHRDARGHPSSAALAPFTDAAGWDFQHVSGPRWWYYVKGTRTSDGSLPERWYVHVNGRRVHDSIYHGLWVMNPGRVGWRRHVAALCPGRCFLDGVGEAGRRRTVPSITGQWSEAEWQDAVAGLAHHVAATGDAVLANSAFSPGAVRALTAAAGRVSTEGFKGLGDVPLVRAGRTWVFGKATTDAGCGYLLAAYLIGSGAGDRFSCFRLGTEPWVVPPTLEGPRVGRAVGRAVKTRLGYRRVFRYAVVRAHRDGSYSIRSR